MMTILIVVIVLLVTIGTLFMYLSPEFGGKPTEAAYKQYAKSKHFKEGKFVNNGDVEMEMSAGDMFKAITGMLKTIPNSVPGKNIETEKIDSLDIVGFGADTRLVWFGHSTFLLQIDSKTILIDPMFGEVPAPHPLLGNKRFSNELPIDIEKLPSIDAVFITHDHYDHLDYGSIQKLKEKVKIFYTPLGVGAHLQAWGIDQQDIVEMDWWQEETFEGLTIRCTPAQHFSGRGISDRAHTLWSSWIIQSPKWRQWICGPFQRNR